MNPLSGVLAESWQLYKTYARHLLTISFIVYLISALISALLQELGGFVGLLFASLITVIAVFLLQAALVKAVQDVRDGTVNESVGQTFSAAMPYLGPVAAASVLAGILIVLGLALLIIPGLFLITIWCLIVPVIVLEQGGVLTSFGRSYNLVRQSFWNVLGTLFLVYLILFVVQRVIALIFSWAPYYVENFLGTVIGGTLIAPFIAVVVTLMYFRLQATVPTGPYPAGGPPPAGGYGDPYGGQPQGGYGPPPSNPYGTGYPPSS